MKINFYCIFLLSSLILSNCHTKVDKANKLEAQSFIHDTISVDPELIDSNIKEQADLIMEGEPEVWSIDDEQNKDTTNRRKKSSVVKIVILQDDLNDIEMTDKLRCIADLKNDTIHINIGINTGFGGSGINIIYTGNKLSTNIYRYTDVVYPNEKKRKYKIENQKLVLDKSTYKTGDSLYGYVYVRMVDDENVKYYADGFFRAKLTN